MMLQRILHRALAAGIVAAMLFFTEGCAGMNQLQNKLDQAIADNKDVFLAQVEQKYDVNFVALSYTGSSVVVKEEFRCYAEGSNPQRDYVRVFREEVNGETIFRDDYFGVLIRPEYEKRVGDIVNAQVGASKAFIYRYTAAFFDNSLTAEDTLDDAIAMGERIHASKYLFWEVEPGSEEQFRTHCDQIAQALSQAGLPGTVKFIGLAAGELENVSGDNFLVSIPDMVEPDGKICLMMHSVYVSV